MQSAPHWNRSHPGSETGFTVRSRSYFTPLVSQEGQKLQGSFHAHISPCLGRERSVVAFSILKRHEVLHLALQRTRYPLHARVQALLMQAHTTLSAHAIRASSSGLHVRVVQRRLSAQAVVGTRCAANGAGSHVNEYLPGDMPPIHVRCETHS